MNDMNKLQFILVILVVLVIHVIILGPQIRLKPPSYPMISAEYDIIPIYAR